MKERLLFILNPNAGLQKANKYLTDILCKFSEAGYVVQVAMTRKDYSATDIINEFHNTADMIVCVGGDGTLNQTISGVMRNNYTKKLGYIPTGSVNDFARGLKLSKDVVLATENILNGIEVNLDIGKFNDNYFSYVAACGLFTRVAYDTQQEMKNIFGRLAYIFNGMQDLTNVKPVHLKIEAGDISLEDDYIFAAVCNATSVGGVLKLEQDLVDLSDGLLELFLIKMPKSARELEKIGRSLTKKEYNTDFVTLLSVSDVKIECSKDISWTLDGEYMQGSEIINISNINKGIKFIVPKN